MSISLSEVISTINQNNAIEKKKYNIFRNRSKKNQDIQEQYKLINDNKVSHDEFVQLKQSLSIEQMISIFEYCMGRTCIRFTGQQDRIPNMQCYLYCEGCSQGKYYEWGFTFDLRLLIGFCHHHQMHYDIFNIVGKYNNYTYNSEAYYFVKNFQYE